MTILANHASDYRVRWLRSIRTLALTTIIGLLVTPVSQATPTLLSSELFVGGSLAGLSGTTPASVMADYQMSIDEPEFAGEPNFGGGQLWSPSPAISASQLTSATVTAVGVLLDFDVSLLIDGSSSIDFGLDPGSSVQIDSIAILTLVFQVHEASTFEISNSSYSASSSVSTATDLFQIADVNDLANPLFDLLPAAGGGFDGTGALQPGSYQLQTRIDHSFIDNGFASQNLAFSFRVVPEPSTALLLGVGLVALAVGRDQRQIA